MLQIGEISQYIFITLLTLFIVYFLVKIFYLDKKKAKNKKAGEKPVFLTPNLSNFSIRYSKHLVKSIFNRI